ncbi:MAG: reverse transcriptase domain-containing protein, partial [Candidatus Paceibacterota bacterium]
MSRFREISAEISPSNVVEVPRRLSNTSVEKVRGLQRRSEPMEADHQLLPTPMGSSSDPVNLSAPSATGSENDRIMESSSQRRGTPRMRTGGMPAAKLAKQVGYGSSNHQASYPPSSSHALPPPVSLELASDSEASLDPSEDSSDEYVHSILDEGEDDSDSLQPVADPLLEAPYHFDDSISGIPFSYQMGNQLERMYITNAAAHRLWTLGVHSLDKLFILKEDELTNLCGFRMADVLSFRLAKSLYDQSRTQGLPSGLVSAMPIFRGSEKEIRAIADPTSFIQRFEAVLATSNVHESRWANLLTINLARPEDSAFWRHHLEITGTNDWSVHRRLFLEHFECYDQRSKYIDEVYNLKQKPDESVQRYFDAAAETIRKAQLAMDDPLVIGCLRRGIYHTRLQEFITLREEPRKVFSYHQLMSLALLGEDRLKISVRNHPNSFEGKKVQKRCNICQQFSHRTYECPRRKRSSSSHEPNAHKEATHKKPRQDCPRCPKETHAARDCPKQVCNNCKQSGHLFYNCPKAKCSACGANGHIASSFNCPKRPNKGKLTYSDRVVEHDVRVEQEMNIARNMGAGFDFGETLEQIMICAFEQRRPQIVSDTTISIPVVLESYQCMGMIDTGASHSIINMSVLPHVLLELSDLEAIPHTGQTIFIGVKAIPLYRTPRLRLMVGKYQIERQFYVADIFTTFVIGRDLLSAIGITLDGLPTAFPQVEEDLRDSQPSSSSIVVSSSSSEETHEVFTSLQRIDLTEMETLISALEKSLVLNEAIPESSFCNHTEAIVSVEMEDKTPIYRPQFEIPVKLQPIIDDQVEKWLALGKIEIASPANRWNSALLIVPKQDLYGNKSDWRVCFDARAINSRLKPDTDGIPRIKELFKRINGFNYSSSLDLVSAYQQLLVKEEDRDVLTFTWKRNKYRFRGAPFGLTHLPGQFQRLMNCVLAEHYQYVIIYLDDVFIFSKTLGEHIEHCNKVIQTLTEYNLRLRRGKCHFGYTEAVLLGHVISGQGLRADPRKIATFAAMRPPTTGRQLQALLGFASYLRDYIPKYSMIAAPLEAIKNVKKLTTVWNSQHEEAFELLKKVLSSSTVLSMPNFDYPFMVATDSSQFGNGAVLYQEINGQIKYIQFFAKA